MKKLKITLSSLLLLIAANTLFSQTYNADDDEVDFYVPGILANDAMQQVNFLLCFMKNTNFESFIDKGVYKALVDEAQCQSASGLDAASEALKLQVDLQKQALQLLTKPIVSIIQLQ